MQLHTLTSSGSLCTWSGLLDLRLSALEKNSGLLQGKPTPPGCKRVANDIHLTLGLPAVANLVMPDGINPQPAACLCNRVRYKLW